MKNNKYKHMKYFIINILILSVFINCGGSDDSEPTPPPPKNPEDATLVFPEKNSECTEGTNKTPTNSTVQFNWDNSLNTDSYELVLKNLESGTTTNHTSATSELSIELLRATPYSWYIVSKSTSITTTGKSDTWKFYNAGEAAVWYAPFPAEVVAPLQGAIVLPVGDKITLDWTANDVDNDIVSYDVYFGTTNIPPSFMTELTNSTVSDVAVIANTTYYWYVVTKDEQGNSSNSEVFEFTTD